MTVVPEFPTDLTFGYVSGRIVLSIGDTSNDPDALPDIVPAVGKVVFIPSGARVFSALPAPTTVLQQAITCTVSSDGWLIDPTGRRGVWLPVGIYTVNYEFARAKHTSHPIEVLAEHTEAAPLYLSRAVPPEGTPLTVSEFTVLSARIDSLGTGGVVSVNGATGTVVLSAADVNALPDTYTPPAPLWGTIPDKPATFPPTIGTTATTAMAGNTPIPTTPGDIGAATSAQGALADSAVQPADLGSYTTDVELSSGLAGKSNTGHTHPVTDLTTTGTADATTVLHGDGEWKVAATGGGAAMAFSSTPTWRLYRPQRNGEYLYSLGTIYLAPIVIPAELSLDGIGFLNKGAGAGGVVTYGTIYDDTGNFRPGNLIAQTAAIDTTNGTGNRASTFTPTVLQPGCYWMGVLNVGGTTPPSIVSFEIVANDHGWAVMPDGTGPVQGASTGNSGLVATQSGLTTPPAVFSGGTEGHHNAPRVPPAVWLRLADVGS